MERELDWSTRDGTTPWSQSGALADANNTDLTELVRSWANGETPNYGVLLTAQVRSNGDWPDLDPYLTIVYSP